MSESQGELQPFVDVHQHVMPRAEIMTNPSEIPFHPTGYRWNVRGNWFPSREQTIGHLIADHNMTIDAAIDLSDDELRRVHDEIHNRQMVGQAQDARANDNRGAKAAFVGLGLIAAIIFAIFGFGGRRNATVAANYGRRRRA